MKHSIFRLILAFSRITIFLGNIAWMELQSNLYLAFRIQDLIRNSSYWLLPEFLWFQFWEFVTGSTDNPLTDISLYSYHLSAWNFMDIVGRNSVLNTHRGWRLKRHRTKRSSSIKRLVVKAPKFVSPLASGHLYQATVITFAVSPNVLFVLSSTCSDRNYSNNLGMIF